jgi:hypothetical protein
MPVAQQQQQCDPSRLLSISLHGPLRQPWPPKTFNCFCLAPLVALDKRIKAVQPRQGLIKGGQTARDQADSAPATYPEGLMFTSRPEHR